MNDPAKEILENTIRELMPRGKMTKAIPRCLHEAITVIDEGPWVEETAKFIDLYECTGNGVKLSRGVFTVYLDCTTGTELVPSCPDLKSSCFAFMVDVYEKRADFVKHVDNKLKAGIAALEELNSEPTPIVVGA